MLMTTVIYFAAGLFASLVLTPICRRVAERLGRVARPSDDRWHRRPTALFGGIAIAVPTLVLGATLPLVDVWQMLVCGAGIAVVGCVDDIISLKPYTKLIAQIVFASAMLFFGFRLQWTDSLVGDTMLTLFWIVGITNAFNLLDNMDGLCAGTALVAGGFLLFGLPLSEAGAPALYLAGMLGACTGFLVYNFHPASIFMGDTGSLFLGFNLAALTLLSNARSSGRTGALSAIAAPVLLLMVPILDTTLVTLIRLLSGRRPSQGGRDHTSHRLVAIGLSQPMAVAVLWTLAAAGGGAAIALERFEASWSAIVLTAMMLGIVIFAVYLARVRVYADADFKRLREGNLTPIIVDFMHKRRVAEVLLDLCLTTLAYYTAYRLRFGGTAFAENYPLFLQSLPVVVTCQLLALFAVGGYRGIWHYFGMVDAVVLAEAVALGTVAAQIALLYAYRFQSYSRAAFVIYAAVVLLLLSGSRASFRLLSEFVQRRDARGARCVVYGTGTASVATIREAFGERPLRIVGFVDDDPQQQQLRVGGYSVLGTFDALNDLLERDQVDCVVLNTRLIDVDRLIALDEACQRLDVELLRLEVHVKPLVAAS
jgi:UDP-GlcNAc:undecaprenyl-phosphate/decaprenyl-phosphate GlcNAc-1-phosphate transferase